MRSHHGFWTEAFTRHQNIGGHTIVRSAGTELLLRYLEDAIVTLLKIRPASVWSSLQSAKSKCCCCDRMNSGESYLFLVHYNYRESHLLGPRAHDCCDGFPTGLFQTVPEVLCRTQADVGMITNSRSPHFLLRPHLLKHFYAGTLEDMYSFLS